MSPPPVSVSHRHYGADIEANRPVVALAEILQRPERYRGRPMVVQGEVIAVCQHQGCWMEIRDQATQAHVRMHGHSFFVPRDIVGRHASAQGTLVAAHPATECDHEASEATKQIAQLEFDATGINVD